MHLGEFMVTISINPKLCKHDAICVHVCPESVFIQRDNESVPEPVRQDLCISCGQCVAVCPHGALTHSEFVTGSIQNIEPDKSLSYDQLITLIRNRRSHRYFNSHPVDAAIIRQIIEAAIYAPTAFNSQSTKYMVIQDILLLTQITESIADSLEEIINQLRKNNDETVLQKDRSFPILTQIVSEVRNGNDMILHNAPVLLLFYGDINAGMGGINANIAIQNAALAAESLGVGAFYTGYVLFACRQDPGINELLKIPKNHEIYGGLALGYPKIRFKKWITRNPPDIIWR